MIDLSKIKYFLKLVKLIIFLNKMNFHVNINLINTSSFVFLVKINLQIKISKHKKKIEG